MDFQKTEADGMDSAARKVAQLLQVCWRKTHTECLRGCSNSVVTFCWLVAETGSLGKSGPVSSTVYKAEGNSLVVEVRSIECRERFTFLF